MFFPILLTIVIVQRLAELWIARRNEKWIIEQGGFEIGREHYKYIVTLHLLFFVSLLSEVIYYEKQVVAWWVLPFSIFILAQIMRVWSITSLGRYWNTRIMILPGMQSINKGPYRFMRHPNYAIVITEILTLPLIFEAYITASVFTILNLAILTVRIRVEERALMDDTDYKIKFEKKARFIPRSDN